MRVRDVVRAAALAATLMTGAAGAAGAQSPIKLGVAGGVAVPTGDIADAVDRGFNGTVTLAVNAPLFPLGLRVDGMFNRLSGKEDAGLVGATAGPDLDVSSLNANLTYNLLPLPIARIYLIGGAGYYRAAFDGADSDTDRENKVGFNGGVGLRLGTGRSQLFVEARYHRVDLDNTDAALEFIPVTVGFLF